MKPLFLSLVCLSLAAQEPAPAPQQAAAQGGAAQAPAPAHPKRPWNNVTTLSYVATAGNAEGQTIGFGNEFLYKWAQSAFSLKAGAIRVNTTVVTRMATGTSLQDYALVENRTPTTTAESYFLSGRYDHRLKDKDRWYWYGGAGWERNRPAGLDNKYTSTAGFGRIWADSDRTKFRTDAGFGYTHEQPLVPPANFQSNYGTFNLTSQVKQKVGASTLYTVDLALTDSLSDSQDYQGVLRQGLTVSINKTLALKIGYDVTYKNHPNLIPVEVFSLDVPPVSLGKISVPAKRTDTVFTTSLVITF
jgi:putative salt-induced outer membrane protein YdiY